MIPISKVSLSRCVRLPAAKTPTTANGKSGSVTALAIASIARIPATRYASIVVWSSRSGSSRSRASGAECGASPRTLAIPGFVPSPPLIATYGPDKSSAPPATSTIAPAHLGQLILVARCSGSMRMVHASAIGSKIPSGRVK